MGQEISMPGAFGGLVRFKEEYDSKLKIKPAHVILMIILVLIGVVSLKLFFPIAG